MSQKLSDSELTALAGRLALSYFHAYDKKAVKDGATFDEWEFAHGADYWSPYFGNQTIDLESNPVSVEDSASLEALSYSVEFDNWGPIDFVYFPTPKGVAWKTHFEGTRKKDGVKMDFFAYSYLFINEYGEITHWETHVNAAYNDFLDVALGVHGPFQGSESYMAAVNKKLSSAGIDISKALHPKKSS